MSTLELAPHPVFRLPTKEEAERLGLDAVNEWIQKRDEAIEAERRDPYNNGFEPEVWDLVDDLLVDGNKVILDLTRIAKLSPTGKAPLEIDVPKEIEGAPEIWLPGANRSSKSEYGGKKIMKVLLSGPDRRTWSFADTGPISIARQQPIFWRYMPAEIKRLAADTGKARQGVTLNVSYKQKTGFAEQSFVFPNASQHWFKNYEQDLQNVEGDQLDAIWLDELRNIELLRTLRGRTIDRGGLIIVTFTSIDENYTSVVNEYERGARTVLEVEAELLPIKRPINLSGNGERDQQIRRTPEDGIKVDPLTSLDGGVKPEPKPSAQNNLSAVSVPTEPSNRPSSDIADAGLGEAREGTNGLPSINSRGGGQQISANGNIVHVSACSDTTKDREEPRTPEAENKGGPGKENLGRRSSTGPTDFEIIGYEKVPRVKVAGPGNDGNLRANIVFFHITDNPYFGYEGAMSRRRDGRVPLFGKERFYRAYRNATRAKILSRVYGILQAGSSQQFPKFSDAVHVVEPNRIPRHGSNFHIADPCDGRNWAMLWIRIEPAGRWYVYREWPSTGGAWAYIPGISDPGPWTLPGKPFDGVRGPGQTPSFGFGLAAYKAEIRRLEGWPDDEAAPAEEPEESASWVPMGVQGVRPRHRRLPGRRIPDPDEGPQPTERIEERWMDSRYAARPTNTKEGQTTLLDQCEEIGLEFKAASGKEISEGTALINDMLDYDSETPLGQFSKRLGRLNAPKLYVSSECRNTIYALREWTGKDGNKGACKDWIDLLRYAALAELDFVGEDSYTWE